MKNDFKKHKKSDSVKWIATLLAFMLLTAGLLAVITQGFKNWNPYGWFDKKTETETASSLPESYNITVKKTSTVNTTDEYIRRAIAVGDNMSGKTIFFNIDKMIDSSDPSSNDLKAVMKFANGSYFWYLYTNVKQICFSSESQPVITYLRYNDDITESYVMPADTGNVMEILLPQPTSAPASAFHFNFLEADFPNPDYIAPSPTVLPTPVVTIDKDGLASWAAVENATGYIYKINGGAEKTTLETSVQLAAGDIITVMAFSDNEYINDSTYSSVIKYVSVDSISDGIQTVKDFFGTGKQLAVRLGGLIGGVALVVVLIVAITKKPKKKGRK